MGENSADYPADFAAKQNTDFKLKDWSLLEDQAVYNKTSLYKCMGDEPNEKTEVDCFKRSTSNWNDQLNNVYSALKQELNPKASAALVKAEREWVDFQQTELKAIDTILGNPGNDVARERAKSDLHMSRAEQLRTSASDYDVPDLGMPTNQCLEKARDVRGTNACYIDRVRIANANMKGTFELLLDKLNPKERRALNASQAEWKEFRDHENTYIHNLHGQRGAQINVSAIAAQVQIVEDRTKQFDWYLRNRN